MARYFINEIEVDEQEFYAELQAQTRAYVDENFEECLIGYSDNPEPFFLVGAVEFDEMDIFNLLSDTAQDAIIEGLVDFYYQDHLDSIDEYGRTFIDVDGGDKETSFQRVG